MRQLFLLLIHVFFISNLHAQQSVEQRLQKAIYSLTAAKGSSEIQLADKMEFDPADNTIYYIDRKEGAIRQKTQAWKLQKEGQQEILTIKLDDKREICIRISGVSDSLLSGSIHSKCSGIKNIPELAGTPEWNVRLVNRNKPDVRNVRENIVGNWKYKNQSDEFEWAGNPLSENYTYRFQTNGQIEAGYDDEVNIIETYRMKLSTQGRYLHVYHPKFKKESLHFVYWLNKNNLFLTTEMEKEIKNMQLQKSRDAQKEGLGFAFYHMKGTPIPVSAHRSYNLIQEVEKGKDGVVRVKRKNTPLPEKIEGAYPLVYTQSRLPDMYLKSAKYVNAEDPAIKALTAKIMQGKQFTNQHELVTYVIKQCAGKIKYGNSDLIPTAAEALKTGVGNCIGFTHLSAAVLRNLGIPTRNIRVYLTSPMQNTSIDIGESAGNFTSSIKSRLVWVPHYILEVFYPSLNQWVSFDPQSRLRAVSLNAVVLYDTHDWDMPKHRISRPLAEDDNLIILGENEPRPINSFREAPQISGLFPTRVAVKPGEIFSVYTRQPLEDIVSIDYVRQYTKTIRLIKDDQDERKWTFYLSTLNLLGYREDVSKIGRVWDFGGDGFTVTDKYGTVTTYRKMENYEFAEPEYIFDLFYYKKLLTNIKLVDTQDGFTEFAFCGNEMIRFERNKAAIPPLRAPYKIRLNARRGLHIDVLTKAGQPQPFTLRLNVSEDGSTVLIGEKKYQLVKESYCHK